MKWLPLCFLCLFFYINSLTAQCDYAVENYAVGFDSLDAQSFTFLDDLLDEVRILGYGEDTHGTAEFTELAEELMNYLSEKHDFKLFIIETGFGEGQYLNDYIQGESADLKLILQQHNSTWRYRTTEFFHLMNWLKSYNQSHSEKIYIYGCEMQYVLSDRNRIQDYLGKVGSDYRIEGFEKHLWQDMNETEKLEAFNAYAQLKQYFISNYDLFIEQSSKEAFDLAFHHVEVLGQYVTTINQNEVQRKYDFRDIYMGENIQWILNYHGNQSKALYWAHNAHVGDWINNGIVDVTGHQLKKLYGSAYFNIATDFGKGRFYAFSEDGSFDAYGYDSVLENTFSACLMHFGKPNTFLNLRKAREDASLTRFLNSELTTMSGAGAQKRSHVTETNDLGKAFDAVIYIHSTHPISWYK